MQSFIIHEYKCTKHGQEEILLCIFCTHFNYKTIDFQKEVLGFAVVFIVISTFNHHKSEILSILAIFASINICKFALSRLSPSSGQREI